MTGSIDELLFLAIDEGLTRQFDSKDARALKFFIDIRLAAKDPDAFARSITHVLGEPGSSLVRKIGEKLLELTGMAGQPWSSFRECVELARSASTRPFTTKLRVRGPLPKGVNFLLEADPATPYERAVGDYLVETNNQGYSTFAFTSRGSPVYEVLAKSKEIKIYSMTSSVSYPKETDQPTEVQVPLNDQALLLDVLDKAFESSAGKRVSLVFDNLSKLSIGFGPENLHRFVMQATEILSRSGAASIFIIIRGAQDERTSNFVKSLFPNHIVYDTMGMRATRLSDELMAGSRKDDTVKF